MKEVILLGNVLRYRGDGRKLGYPTANIDTQTDLADGVYFGFADLAGYHNHPCLIFVGAPVTVGDSQRRVEAHLLDISDVDYYGEELTLRIVYCHRPNQKFDSLDQLVVAMKDDEAAARAWFAGQPHTKQSMV